MSVMNLTIMSSNIDDYRNGIFPKVTDLYWQINDSLQVEILGNFPNLQMFDCSNNRLTSLNGIQVLTKLKMLNCSFNQLDNLDGIENLIELEILYCDRNNLSSLTDVSNLIKLHTLSCFKNKLSSLNGL